MVFTSGNRGKWSNELISFTSGFLSVGRIQINSQILRRAQKLIFHLNHIWQFLSKPGSSRRRHLQSPSWKFWLTRANVESPTPLLQNSRIWLVARIWLMQNLDHVRIKIYLFQSIWWEFLNTIILIGICFKRQSEKTEDHEESAAIAMERCALALPNQYTNEQCHHIDPHSHITAPAPVMRLLMIFLVVVFATVSEALAQVDRSDGLSGPAGLSQTKLLTTFSIDRPWLRHE